MRRQRCDQLCVGDHTVYHLHTQHLADVSIQVDHARTPQHHAVWAVLFVCAAAFVENALTRSRTGLFQLQHRQRTGAHGGAAALHAVDLGQVTGLTHGALHGGDHAEARAHQAGQVPRRFGDTQQGTARQFARPSGQGRQARRSRSRRSPRSRRLRSPAAGWARPTHFCSGFRWTRAPWQGSRSQSRCAVESARDCRLKLRRQGGGQCVPAPYSHGAVSRYPVQWPI